jgi:hypothetical protein
MSYNLSVENDSNDNEFILKSVMNDYNNNNFNNNINSNTNSITDDHTDLDDLTTLTNATPVINKIQIQKSQQQNNTPSTEINNNINVYIENHVMEKNLKDIISLSQSIELKSSTLTPTSSSSSSTALSPSKLMIEYINQKLQQNSNETNYWSVDRDLLMNRLTMLENNIVTLTNNINDVTLNLNNEINKNQILLSASNENDNNIKKYQYEIHDLKDLIDTLRIQLNDNKDNYLEYYDNEKNLLQIIEDEKNKYQNLEKFVEELKVIDSNNRNEELLTYHNHLSQKDEMLIESNNKIIDLNNEIITKNNDIENLNLKIQNNENRITDLEKELFDLQQTDSLKGLQITKKLLHDINMKYDILNKQCIEITNNNKILNERNNYLEKTNIDYNEIIINLKTQIYQNEINANEEKIKNKLTFTIMEQDLKLAISRYEYVNSELARIESLKNLSSSSSSSVPTSSETSSSLRSPTQSSSSGSHTTSSPLLHSLTGILSSPVITTTTTNTNLASSSSSTTDSPNAGFSNNSSYISQYNQASSSSSSTLPSPPSSSSSLPTRSTTPKKSQYYSSKHGRYVTIESVPDENYRSRISDLTQELLLLKENLLRVTEELKQKSELVSSYESLFSSKLEL